MGAGDKVDASKYPWNWETKDYDDTAWPNAKNTWFATRPGALAVMETGCW